MPSKKEMLEEQKIRPQVMRGLVVSAKLSKTVTILVEGVVTHPLYQKTVKRSKRYLVHDELGVKEGDVVEVVQIRPVSKLKSFNVAKVVGRDIELMASEDLKEDVAEAIAEVLPAEKEEDEISEVEDKTEKVEESVEVKTKKVSKKTKEKK